MIQKDSPIPIYYQLEEYIKENIEKGILLPGDALPSEREYAEKYQISRMTVRQAFTQLVNQGYLQRLQGKGTFVADRKKKIEQVLQGLTGFTEDMTSRGIVPGTKLIQFKIIPAPTRIASDLQIQEADSVYEIQRIRLGDDIPMAIETNYLPTMRIIGLSEEIVTNSLYSYIEKDLKLTITHASQFIEASVASEWEAEQLQIEVGAPVLLIVRNTFGENGTPIEVVKSVYRGDRYTFMIDMKRV